MNHHITVLLTEVLDALQVRQDGQYLDVTAGGGGHTEGVLKRGGRILGTDADLQAVQRCHERLANFGERAILKQAWMDEAVDMAASAGLLPLDGIVADLGLSSNQLEFPERGFSFMREGPLDMRFDTTRGLPASEWLNRCTQAELAHTLHEWGDVEQPGRVASIIWQARPIHSTTQLRDLLATQIKRRNRNIHPATQVFQALRIAVNDEFNRLARALPRMIDALAPGGRLAVIAFHSLEDRLVKNVFRGASMAVRAQPGFGDVTPRAATVRLVNRKPIEPSAAELTANPRSRSAVLRVVEKL